MTKYTQTKKSIHRYMDVRTQVIPLRQFGSSLISVFACAQKSSTSLLRICVYAQIIQRWKTLLSEIIIRNFCACTQKSSTSLLRICVYAQKIQQMIIIKSSNNPIVDVLRGRKNSRYGIRIYLHHLYHCLPKFKIVKLNNTQTNFLHIHVATVTSIAKLVFKSCYLTSKMLNIYPLLSGTVDNKTLS